MASSASRDSGTARAGQVLTNKELLRRLKKRRDDEGEIRSGAADKIIQKYLDQGGSLGHRVVDLYNKVDSPYFARYDPMRRTPGMPYGRSDDYDLEGLRGLKLNKGEVYLGSTPTEFESQSSRTPNGGLSYTPGRVELERTILPRWMLGGVGSSQDASLPATSPSDSSALKPSKELKQWRKAYDRASAYSGSAVSPDLTASGPDLMQNIYDSGTSGLDDYKSRFLDQILAGANLTAHEIGFSGRQAIADLPDDLNLADYDKVFPNKAKQKGIYNWLQKQIA